MAEEGSFSVIGVVGASDIFSQKEGKDGLRY